jgi:hypothetical protein
MTSLQDIAVTGGAAKAVVNIARTGTLTGRDAAAAALAELSAANSKTATVSTSCIYAALLSIAPPSRPQHHSTCTFPSLRKFQQQSRICFTMATLQRYSRHYDFLQ